MTTKTKKTYEPIPNLEGEVWKDIPNYGGKYKVSNKGRVKSLKYRKERLMRFDESRDGYYRVTLYKNDKTHREFVHRIVYRVFVGELPRYDVESGGDAFVINHKDENHKNNSIENLEVITVKANNNYGTKGKRISIAKSKKVYQYSLCGKFIREWDSITQAKKIGGFSDSLIVRVCRHQRNKHKGYIWSYEPIENK